MDNNFQDETLLARWLAGALTPEELEALQQREDYADFVEIIEGMEGLRLPEYRESEQWQHLQQKLVTEKKNPVPQSPSAERTGSIVNPKSKIRKLNPWRRIASIAAALAVIALGIWWFAGKNGGAPNVDTSIATATGEQREINLPDGSQVTLNAKSKLEYSAAGWDGERRVELSGEAFFKAKKGTRFTVQTELGKVEVVGTQFNVYARDRELEVKCTEGKVQVTSSAGTERVLLGAGEQVTVLEGRMQQRQAVETPPVWFAGESSFRSAPLERVFGEMERQFGVVVVADSAAGRTFSGKFVHQDLEKALRMVCGPMGLEWTVAGDTVRVGK